ncbi:lipopolysaccharide/colanic/teichoic acid biosynthesis glycosyltransferase [Sphingomonas sp. SORGH_AS 879]|nr:lipopolysaccharide/colanic/teichoic acid biosynthesis glycosyltransferase [Sphingomonas sp. SORGH_AS_0879]
MDMGRFHSKAPMQRVRRLSIPASILRFRALITLILIDLICVAAGFAGAAYFRFVLLGHTRWTLAIVTLLSVYFLTSFSIRAYDQENLTNPRHAAAQGAKALLLSVCAVILVAFVFQASEDFPRVVIALGALIGTLLIASARYAFVRNMAQLIGGNPFTVMLLHDGRSPIPQGEFSQVIETGDRFDPNLHDPIMYDRLARLVASADRVVVACAPDTRIAWANALKGTGVQSEIFVPELSQLAPLGISSCAATPTMIVAVGPLGLFDRFLKRLFDIAVSGLALFLLAPVLGIIALLVRLDSPGPILFRQVRIGWGNEMFHILKFRSMYVEGSDGAGHRSASRDDDRITRVGRFIRMTSMDELPQIINVLKGDMSIVGPRPHALGSRAAEKLFWEVDGRYWQRHSVKPGLTGLAQVRGYRGATLIEDDLRNRLQADLEYLEHWSIWRDIRIVLQTFQVLLHRNAY